MAPGGWSGGGGGGGGWQGIPQKRKAEQILSFGGGGGGYWVEFIVLQYMPDTRGNHKRSMKVPPTPSIRLLTTLPSRAFSAWYSRWSR